MKTEPVHLHLAEGDYVLIPRAEYLRLCGQQQSEGVPVVEAKEAVMREMGRRVRLAREHAGLTQSALAAKLGVTQARVSRAESGTVSLSSAFFARVHKACKLPLDWVP
jgi:ribosome-binding protein aMBF1 (putative translation factor)